MQKELRKLPSVDRLLQEEVVQALDNLLLEQSIHAG